MLKDVITADEQEEIKEFVSILLLLPKEANSLLVFCEKYPLYFDFIYYVMFF